MSATSMVMLPDWVSVPERVSELSASRVPPLMDIVEASSPASSNLMEPAVTVIAPDKLLPSAIDTGVVWATVRLLTVELLSTSRPELASEVLTLSTVIELLSRSLLLALFNTRALLLLNLPSPLRVRVLLSRLSAAP